MVRPEFLEQPVAFGEGDGLSGIVTLPASSVTGSCSTWCVLPNAGIVPRTGVSRLHVRLARSLATIGVSSLRFDLSGIGDSERSSRRADPHEAAQTDLGSAVEFLRGNYDSSTQCYIGLCSAAHDGLCFAATEERVAAYVGIDLIGDLRTIKHVARHYASRLTRKASWLNAVGAPVRALRNLANRLRPGVQGDPPETWIGVRRPLTRNELSGYFGTLNARGIPTLSVFSGGLEENYNYQGQLRDALAGGVPWPLVEEVYLPGASHVFDSWDQQLTLCRLITDWVRSRVIES